MSGAVFMMRAANNFLNQRQNEITEIETGPGAANRERRFAALGK
jgi:hypothetical protein